MHIKRTRVPKIGHKKKSFKSPKIMQNYLKNALKILQNTLFLNTSKWLFISGPSYLAHAKKKAKTRPNLAP
jgi:hypothetical protein